MQDYEKRINDAVSVIEASVFTIERANLWTYRLAALALILSSAALSIMGLVSAYRNMKTPAPLYSPASPCPDLNVEFIVEFDRSKGWI